MVHVLSYVVSTLEGGNDVYQMVHNYIESIKAIIKAVTFSNNEDINRESIYNQLESELFIIISVLLYGNKRL